MLRFVNSKSKSKVTGNLQIAELNRALLCIIKQVQFSAFQNEIQCLNKRLTVKSKVSSLALFLYLDNILRVGGRLQNAKVQ